MSRARISGVTLAESNVTRVTINARHGSVGAFVRYFEKHAGRTFASLKDAILLTSLAIESREGDPVVDGGWLDA
jgi:hypothetical protein